MLSKSKRFRGNHRAGNAAMPSSFERKRSLKLALFMGLAESFASPEPPALAPSPTAAKSPRSFDDGAVGLGIVAAMSGDTAAEGRPPPSRPAPPARSEPIPIVSPRPAAWPSWEEEEEEGEMSESYTCVISHVGGNPVRKRVYFDDGLEGIDRNFGADAGVFFQSPPPLAALPPPTPAEGFLSCCYLCRKRLHGLDIFMYRGEKAFCSVECRCQQILSDEHGDKCGSRSRKKPLDYSVSPCPAPLLFAAGVAVA